MSVAPPIRSRQEAIAAIHGLRVILEDVSLGLSQAVRMLYCVVVPAESRGVASRSSAFEGEEVMEHVEPIDLDHDGVFDGTIDIYVDNARVDLAEAKRLNVRAVFYRTAVGLIPKRDDRDAYHAAKARALDLGLKWGAYFVASDEDVDQQLQHFFDIEDGSNPDVALAIDWEATSRGTMSGEKMKDLVSKFKDRKGFFPMLYGGYILREDPIVRRRDALLHNCPLWYIYLLSDTHPRLELPATWSKYALWQFATETRAHEKPYPRDVLPGADFSRFQGSGTALEAAWPFRNWAP